MKENLWGGIDGTQLGPSKLDDPFFFFHLFLLVGG